MLDDAGRGDDGALAVGLAGSLGRSDRRRRNGPDILAAVAEAAPDLGFELWGAPVLSDGAVMKRLTNLPNIRYRGPFTASPRSIWSAVGCLMYTSDYDGTPNLLLEAMGRGLPCLCSAVGGVPDLMAEGRGALMPAGLSASDWAAALRALLADAPARRAMSAAARAHIGAAHDRSRLRPIGRRACSRRSTRRPPRERRRLASAAEERLISRDTLSRRRAQAALPRAAGAGWPPNSPPASNSLHPQSVPPLAPALHRRPSAARRQSPPLRGSAAARRRRRGGVRGAAHPQRLGQARIRLGAGLLRMGDPPPRAARRVRCQRWSQGVRAVGDGPRGAAFRQRVADPLHQPRSTSSPRACRRPSRWRPAPTRRQPVHCAAWTRTTTTPQPSPARSTPASRSTRAGRAPFSTTASNPCA